MRATTQTSAGKTYFLYEGGVPVCELNGTGSVTATNTWGVDGLVSRTAGANSYFHGYDEQGNTAEVFNASGGLVTSTGNDAYGGSVTGLTNTVAGDPYAGFEGQYGYYQDSATGDYLLGHRFYNPGLGRFINRDPIGYAGGINLYGYTGNNPLAFVDPMGTDFTIGNPNNPYLSFNWNDTKQGLAVGLAAVGSSLSFGLYNGGQYRCDSSFGTSLGLANIGRDAALTAAGAGLAGKIGDAGAIAGRFRVIKFGDLSPQTLGETDPFGNITIARGLSGDVLRSTLKHELVHSALSPEAGALFAQARANLAMWAYNNSQLARFLEEAAAESYGSGSLSQGVAYPVVSGGYGLTWGGIAGEGALYAGGVGAAAYGGYSWANGQ